MPIVDTDAILKLVIKLDGIVILSGFGGNTIYAVIIITTYISGTINRVGLSEKYVFNLL